MKAALAFLALLLPAWAGAQSVSLGGVMGARALLVIDGQPQTLAVGQTARGVKLLRVEGDTAVVEQGGQQATLRVGGAPSRVAGTAAAGGARAIVIPVGPGGHFVANGAINGRPVQFMVDTGATLIAFGRADAERLGVDWQGGETMLVGTANGTIQAHRVTLTRVRVGDVELANVQAAVMPMSMPMVLLGNSFLSRFSMQRDSDTLRLTAR